MTRHMIDSMKDLPGFGTTCMKGVNYGYVLGSLTRIFYINNSAEKSNAGVMLLDPLQVWRSKYLGLFFTGFI